MPKNARPRSLTFPNAKGRYWMLLWIGKIYYKRCKFKISLFFINKENPNDYVRDFYLGDDCIIKHEVPISYLCEYKIGLIYDAQQCIFISYRQASYSLNVTKNYYSKGSSFPLLNNIYFPIPQTEIDDNLRVLKFYRNDKYREKVPIIISYYNLAEYLFFRTDKLVVKILTGAIIDHIPLGKIKFYQKRNENNDVVRTAEVFYDSNFIKREEAKIISPFLFMKDGNGLKMLKSLYSSLHNFLLNERKINKEAGTYLKMDFNWSDYNMELKGKFFHYDVKSTPEKHTTCEEVFITYAINRINFLNKDDVLIDEIILTPYNSKSSTGDKDNHEHVSVIKLSATTAITLPIREDSDDANSSPPLTNEIQTDAISPFEILFENKDRDTQLSAYSIIPIKDDRLVEGLVREMENSGNEINNLRENIQKVLTEINAMDNFTYFDKVLDILEENYSLSLNRDPLQRGADPYNIQSTLIKVVCVSLSKQSTYLIEFENGMIGIFNDKKFSRIEENSLYSLLEIFISEKEDLTSQKQLWTTICEKREEFFSKFSIIVRTGIRHVRERRLDDQEGEIYSKTAAKVYDRIIKFN